jgi:hypothetical protein
MTRHSKQAAKAPLTSDDRSAVSVGNAALTGRDHTGWFIGPFLAEEAGIRRTDAVEVKWGLHMAGEVRTDLNDEVGTYSLAILITGNFAIEFPTLGEEVMLSQIGDYVLYGPDVAHSWRAVEASTVLTIRWSASDSR